MISVRGGRFLLSDTQINVRQQRHIMSLLLTLILRQEQGVTKYQTKFSWQTNQQRSVPYFTGSTLSWLGPMNLKTNNSSPSQFILFCVPKIRPFQVFYAAFLITLLNSRRENISATF